MKLYRYRSIDNSAECLERRKQELSGKCYLSPRGKLNDPFEERTVLPKSQKKEFDDLFSEFKKKYSFCTESGFSSVSKKIDQPEEQYEFFNDFIKSTLIASLRTMIIFLCGHTTLEITRDLYWDMIRILFLLAKIPFYVK